MAIQVQTTQNVQIEYEAAGIGLRFAGYLIDMLIITLWSTGFWGFFVTLLKNDFTNLTGLSWIAICIYFIPVLFYDLIFECLCNGQSPAKKILKIRVVNLDGTRPSFGSYLIRWLFRLVDFPLSNYIVGLVMVIATDKSQRLGDSIAGTTVINLKASKMDREITLPNLDFDENYQVSYPDLLERLTDKDIRTIRTTLSNKEFNKDEALIKRLSNRLKQVTGYTHDSSDIDFLQKIVDDYTFLALRQ